MLEPRKSRECRQSQQHHKISQQTSSRYDEVPYCLRQYGTGQSEVSVCFLLLCRRAVRARAALRSRSLALSSTASFLVLRKQCPRRRASRQTRKTTRQLHRSPQHPPQLLPLACAPRSSASPSASQTVRAWQRARSRYNQAPRRSLVRVRRTCLHPRPRRQCPPPLWLARQPLSRWSILRCAPC